jgi:hypothetical protein
MIEPDLWPRDVLRSWKMTMEYKGLDGRMITKDFVVHEKEHANENLMRMLLEACKKHEDGWLIPSHHVKIHFGFEEMPPASAKVIAFERIDNEITTMREEPPQEGMSSNQERCAASSNTP